MFFFLSILPFKLVLVLCRKTTKFLQSRAGLFYPQILPPLVLSVSDAYELANMLLLSHGVDTREMHVCKTKKGITEYRL